MIMVTGPSYQSYGRTDKAIVNYETFLLLYNCMPPAGFPLDSHKIPTGVIGRERTVTNCYNAD